MRIRPIITRLESDTTPNFFKSIGPANSLSSVDSIASNCPSIWVHPVGEQSQISRLMTGTRQDCDQTFAVLYAAQNIQASSEPLEDARDEVFSALLSFQPSEEHDYIEHVSGEVVEVDKGVIWWRDIFKTIRSRG